MDPADPEAFAGDGAVTAGWKSLNPTGLDKLISWTNANRESVSLGQREPSGYAAGAFLHTGHQERFVPRNSIEEFDPGSA